MDTDGREAFYERIESFVAAKLKPGTRDRERQGEICHTLIKEMGAEGLLAVNVAKELGGQGAGVVAYANAVKRVAEADASVAGRWLSPIWLVKSSSSSVQPSKRRPTALS